MLKKAGELAREVPGIAPFGNRKYPTFKGYATRERMAAAEMVRYEELRQHFWGEGVEIIPQVGLRGGSLFFK